ncbi:hypothetical protein GOODEAATRI_034105, partial [Goodea atripinnis]
MHIVHGFSPALHSYHSTSPKFASNLATSASSLHSTGAQPAPRPLPPGVHLSNARPSLSLGEMHHTGHLSGTVPCTPCHAQSHLRLVGHSPICALSGTVPSTPCQTQSHLGLVGHSPICALSGTVPSTPCQALPCRAQSHVRLVRHSPIYALSGTVPSTPCRAQSHLRLV